MEKIEVFEPSMCCPTGVCGPSVDTTLPVFAADVEWLKTPRDHGGALQPVAAAQGIRHKQRRQAGD